MPNRPLDDARDDHRARTRGPGRGALAGAIVIAGLLWGVAGAGCASAGGTGGATVESDPAGTIPVDLQIDVLVLAAPVLGSDPAERMQPMRIVLAPDGSLHAVSADDLDAWAVPDRLRTLPASDVAATWARARAIGIADPAAGGEPGAPRQFDVPARGVRLRIDVRADGVQRRFVAATDDAAGTGLDEDLLAFADWMAGLAWIDGPAADAAVVIPRRYDLGADPWQRYRGGAG